MSEESITVDDIEALRAKVNEPYPDLVGPIIPYQFAITLLMDNEKLRAENDRLKEHLRDYARHNEGCSGGFDGCRCKCGYEDSCKEWEEAGE